MSRYLIQQLDKMDDSHVTEEKMTCLNTLIDTFKNFTQFDDRLRKFEKEKVNSVKIKFKFKIKFFLLTVYFCSIRAYWNKKRPSC